MAHSKPLEEISRIVECPLCLERMVDPRMLPCLHTFCEKCLERHMVENQVNGSFRCPMCNESMTVPEDGVTSFKRNFFISQVSDLCIEENSETTVCDMCKHRGRDVKAESVCIHCPENLCHDCALGHCNTKLTRDHRVVLMNEVKDGQHFEEMRRCQKVYCLTHKDEVLKIYCEDCEKPLCFLCKALEHDQHKMKTLEGATLAVEDDIRRLLGPWEKVAGHSKKISGAQRKILDRIDDQLITKTDAIKQMYSQFKSSVLQEIKMQEKAAIDGVANQLEFAKKQTKVALEEAEFSKVKFTSAVEYVQSILASGRDVEKLHQFQDIKNRLDGLDVNDLKTTVIEPEVQVIGFSNPKVKTEIKMVINRREIAIPLEGFGMKSNALTSQSGWWVTTNGIRRVQAKGRRSLVTRQQPYLMDQNKTQCDWCEFCEDDLVPVASCSHTFCRACLKGIAETNCCLICKRPSFERFFRGSASSGTLSDVINEEDKCAICLDEISDPKVLKKCKHTFCRECIDEWFNHKPTCAVCGELYGFLVGTQPRNGRMTVRTDAWTTLQGYPRGAIVIDYYFPNGTQEANHPNPGQSYYGASRIAYLPDTSEGRWVLALLRKAFDARLVFTIGRSVTSGQDNVVTWNDIHHKTNIRGGASHFGYPDPDYLKRVTEELRSKGIM